MATTPINVSISVEGAALVAVLGLIAIVLHFGLQAIGRHIPIYTFNDYSQRYHQILSRFPVQVWTTKGVTLASFSEAQASELLDAYGDFFRLLASERHLQRIHFIDARTWRLWSSSTRHIMSMPISKEAWERLRPRFSYDPKFQRFVDGLV